MTDDQPYDDAPFWRKVRRFALRAGRRVIEQALVLYLCLRDPATPRWAKGVIIGALAYFVLPLDAVPDFLPGIGYTDDLGVLLTALATTVVHVKPAHRERARELVEWKWATERTNQRDSHRDSGKRGADRTPPGKPALHYAAVLGVPPGSAPQAIRAHYVDLVKKYHPDRVSHLGPEFQEMAEQKMKDINQAYAYYKNRHPEL